MYLWQIRHNPNHPQTLLRFTLIAGMFGACVATSFPVMRSVLGQTGGSRSEASDANQKRTSAEEFLDRVRQELPKHQTIKADLAQTVSIGDQQFKIVGEYLSSAATVVSDHPINRLRLTYTVVPSQGVQGAMLEICDGKELWTELKLGGSRQSVSDSIRVTRRNVQQILSAAISASKQNLPESTLNAELGLGGISALMASLERTMVFDAMKEEQVDGHSRTVLQGHWKKEISSKFRKEKDDSLPPFIPDVVRLVVNNETLFPEKLYYLKKQPQKKTYKALMSLEFTNVEFDLPANEELFQYNLPKEKEIVPEEVTKQYLDRLTAPVDAPAKL